MQRIKRALFIVLNCTWGLPATLVGLYLYIRLIRCPHQPYRGAIETTWGSPISGLSLGLFLFTPDNPNPDYVSKVRVHEYGHSMQNIVLGPLMIFPGMISLVWGNHPRCARLREEKHLPYTHCFVEAWASRWGEFSTGEPAIWE